MILGDELTGNLDTETSTMVMEALIKACRKEKMTTVFVTHDQSLTRFATRIIRLDSGKVVDDEKGGLKSIVNTTKIVAESVVEEAVDGAKKIGSKIKDIAKSIVE